MPTPCITNPNQATKNLLNNLHNQSLNENVTFFGHQDSLAYGRDWYYEKGRIKKNKADAGVAASIGKSDVFDTVKKSNVSERAYPAVFGWDLGELEKQIPDKDYLINGVVISDLRQHIKWVFNNGGVNTISWHCKNPDTLANFKSFNPQNPNDPNQVSYRKPGTVAKVLINGSPAQIKFNQWLDLVIDFFNHPDIAHIPIIFRPLHESNLRNCFWWDTEGCTNADYKKLWNHIYNRFNARGVKNALFAYCINDVWNGENESDETATKNNFKIAFDNRCPDKVDVLGFDTYQSNTQLTGNNYTQRVKYQCEKLLEIATEKNKVAAITEAGIENLPVANWWTTTFAEITKNDNIAYIMLWRNPCVANDSSAYFCSSPNNKTAADFVAFYQNFKIMFLQNVKSLNLYS